MSLRWLCLYCPSLFLPIPLWPFFSTSAMFPNPKYPQESAGNPEAEGLVLMHP